MLLLLLIGTGTGEPPPPDTATYRLVEGRERSITFRAAPHDNLVEGRERDAVGEGQDT